MLRMALINNDIFKFLIAAILISTLQVIGAEEMASIRLLFLLHGKYRLVFVRFYFERQFYVIAYVRQTKFHAKV